MQWTAAQERKSTQITERHGTAMYYHPIHPEIALGGQNCSVTDQTRPDHWTLDSIRNACNVCLTRVQIDQFACEDGQGGRQEHQSSPPRSLQAPARHNLPPEKER